MTSVKPRTRLNSTLTPTPTKPPLASRPSTWISAFVVVGTGVGLYAFASGKTSANSTPLSDMKFTPLKIVSTKPASESSKIITLAVPPHLMPDEPALAPVFSIYIKDSDIQVQRPYTPLKGIDDNGNMDFWIKRYADGEVSRWLHSKSEGDELEVRGPVRTFDFKDGDYDEIIMISGGTGVTPFVQLLNHVFAERTPNSRPLKTHYTLLHSSQTLAALPVIDALYSTCVYSVANRHDLTVRLFVDVLGPVPNTRLHQSHRENVHVRRIGKDDVIHVLQERGVIPRPQTWLEWLRRAQPVCSTKEKKLLFLVCGPEPMITAFSGSRVVRRRPDHLPVEGILGELGFTPKQVKAL
ncbi:NADH-cytochrome b5 reductase 2 OS=Ustilago maydis (strain 521 / FGSC 9021) GN=MCR1 PE=3 SV=1 [Rhizoctonia solani AG-1 IB]|uniref:NADH-cytochrome b5 reductase 2 n=1 Tax=Thanatephorus cucumeris (strain AG1-IB / isolate 7/3/14) TaxID=1108050 RepID=A0A0B7FU19_THACB|nr:NADH-cytochrome b5 reductase 2 OS=Ustilago maydis (strain 521 / FGSC 9021) GN=MCR1 PE=3 SV=1 [Rhizoctonia solani AG-1 IB]